MVAVSGEHLTSDERDRVLLMFSGTADCGWEVPAPLWREVSDTPVGHVLAQMRKAARRALEPRDGQGRKRKVSEGAPLPSAGVVRSQSCAAVCSGGVAPSGSAAAAAGAGGSRVALVLDRTQRWADAEALEVAAAASDGSGGEPLPRASAPVPQPAPGGEAPRDGFAAEPDPSPACAGSEEGLFLYRRDVGPGDGCRWVRRAELNREVAFAVKPVVADVREQLLQLQGRMQCIESAQVHHLRKQVEVVRECGAGCPCQNYRQRAELAQADCDAARELLNVERGRVAKLSKEVYEAQTAANVAHGAAGSYHAALSAAVGRALQLEARLRDLGQGKWLQGLPPLPQPEQFKLPPVFEAALKSAANAAVGREAAKAAEVVAAKRAQVEALAAEAGALGSSLEDLAARAEVAAQKAEAFAEAIYHFDPEGGNAGVASPALQQEERSGSPALPATDAADSTVAPATAEPRGEGC